MSEGIGAIIGLIIFTIILFSIIMLYLNSAIDDLDLRVAKLNINIDVLRKEIKMYEQILEKKIEEKEGVQNSIREQHSKGC